AGKTTTLCAISGLRTISRGQVLFEGKNIADIPPHRLVEKGLAHVPEGRRIFARLTVRENLDLGAYTTRRQPKVALARIDRIFELFPRLSERAQQIAGTMSGGEQQMLAIGRALMSEPKLILFDEPTMGLAPQLVDQVLETIVQINKDGTTVLLVEQNAFLALEIAARGYVLESGAITLTGPGKSLIDDVRVKQAYLG
ncbi:ABC transporter ATP-binding protein, partial [Mesorhizobium sp. M7D.F.Ca.US.004.03.1.1]|uniref:ABC transporter ATP-binding protein n=1 Tax=Mesorhizobium sp. M7D.F.Ca.US.004.03.1.1 TaxID=2496702 RepID=UPI000FD3BFF5